MIKTITSKDNPRVKFACSLKESKYRKEYQLFLGETKKSMLMALEANILTEVFTLEWLDLPEDIIQNIVSLDVLKKISSNVNPEVVFIAKIMDKKLVKNDSLIYLDHIQDPGNMGTLIRTALAFNFDGVIVSKNCASIYNEKVINSSKGAIYKIPVIQSELIEFKKTHKVIVSTLSNDSQNYKDVEVQKPYILVLGNEAHGIDKNIENLADIKVKIPVKDIDSLNVAIAGGILMAEFSNK